MLVTVNPQRTLWEAILPAECLGMPAELALVDVLLDDARFFEPYRRCFDPLIGRPSVPLETYLRLMFLKVRYGLSYESVCRETADSLSWRRFCRIPLGERVPHPSTLVKTTLRCGERVVAELNEALLAKAREARVIKLDRVRADTTVVQANVAYPTDSGLLARGVSTMAALARRIQSAGLATRTAVRDRTRSMRRRAHEIAAWLRRRTDDAREEVYGTTAEMATIATAAVAEARAVVRNARRGLRRTGQAATGRAAAAVAELERIAELVERVAVQTRCRLAGDTPPGATRVVSLHDPDARPIAKGRLGRPVEFGYLAQIVDNRDGIVLDHQLLIGNPPDAPLLAPAIGRIAARFRRVPRAVAADRGYGEASVEDELTALGVRTVAIPRKGRPGLQRQQIERARRFRRLVKWRTGIEGRISHLKHGFGLDRTRLDGISGARVWCGFGVLTHNSIKIAHLLDHPDRLASTRNHPSDEPPATSRPPPPTRVA